MDPTEPVLEDPSGMCGCRNCAATDLCDVCAKEGHVILVCDDCGHADVRKSLTADRARIAAGIKVVLAPFMESAAAREMLARLLRVVEGG